MRLQRNCHAMRHYVEQYREIERKQDTEHDREKEIGNENESPCLV